MTNGIPQPVISPALDQRNQEGMGQGDPTLQGGGIDKTPPKKNAPVIKNQDSKVRVTGPDGKGYWFKKTTSKAEQDAYFAKKGLIKAPGKTAAQETISGGSPGNVGMMQNYFGGVGTSIYEGTATAMPGLLAAGGSIPLGKRGAFIGGFVGEDIRQMMMRPILLGRGQQDLTASQSLIAMATEGGKQAALQYAGEKMGDYFFKALDKVVPHAVKIKGIPLLPGDLNPNSKMMKYIEDFLGNVGTGAKTMAEFRAAQSAAITKKAETIANGFAKFNGTSEEMGLLIKNTLEKEYAIYEKGLEQIKNQYPKGKARTIGNLMKDPIYKKLADEQEQKFGHELATKIFNTNKPELIAGWLRSGATKGATLEDTRKLFDVLGADIQGKVQNRIMRDVIQETMTGSKDPMQAVAAVKNMSGGKFKSILDGIGEERLKVIYGQKGYKAITDFSNLIKYVDKTQGNGMGRFYNLTLALPFLRGISGKNLGKAAIANAVLARMTKVITSPEGIKVYENLIRAMSAQAPRALEMARQEVNAFNKKTDAEEEQIQKQALEEFKRQTEQQENQLDSQ